MHRFTFSETTRRAQGGIVLVMMLLLLLMVTVLGTAILRMQTAEQRIAVNANNRAVAQANAEAALRYAECGLEGGCGGANWSPAAFSTNAAGLYTLNTATGSSVTVTSPDNAASGISWVAPAGSTLAYAGPTLPTPSAPQYVVEKLPPVVLPGDSMSAEQYSGTGGATPYQITARANGADSSSQATLQSTYRP